MTVATIETPLVAAAQLTVRYGRTVAVDQLSFGVEPGEVYALLGRNGAGKSSLVRCLLGQLKPSSGEARLFGRSSWQTRAKAMARIGVVPETPDMPPEANADQLAAFFRRLAVTWNGKLFSERLRRFGIDHKVPSASLSKGQRRQLGLSLALGSQPQLLLLDDPTLGLDVVARKELYEELISELADHGTTVLLTTHDLAGIEGIASQVGIIDHGRLVLDEQLEQLKERCRRVRVLRASEEDRRLLTPVLQRLSATVTQTLGEDFEWVVTAYDELIGQELRTVLNGGRLRVEPISLEEIFIALCGEENGGNR